MLGGVPGARSASAARALLILARNERNALPLSQNATTAQQGETGI